MAIIGADVRGAGLGTAGLGDEDTDGASTGSFRSSGDVVGVDISALGFARLAAICSRSLALTDKDACGA